MMNCQHVFEGHAGRIFSVALCKLPDGRRIAASASHDRTVRLWSINTLEHIRTIEYTDFVWRVFIVKSSNRFLVVAFISTENKIQVNDLETGELINTFLGRLIYAGNFSIFSQPVIITAVGDEDISFIDVNTGESLLMILGGFEKVFRAVVSNDGHPTVVFTTWNAQNRRSTIQTYDLSGIEGQIIERRKERNHLVFEGDSRDGVTSLVLTLGPKPAICSGHYDFLVRIWDLSTKQLIMTLDGHSDYVGSVAIWRGNQSIIISGSSDGTIKAWDINTGTLITTGDGHNRDVWAVAVSHGPKPLIVSGSFDRTIRIWDMNPILADMNWERRKEYCMFIHAYFSPKLNKLSESDNNASLRVFHNHSLQMLIASYL